MLQNDLITNKNEINHFKMQNLALSISKNLLSQCLKLYNLNKLENRCLIVSKTF